MKKILLYIILLCSLGAEAQTTFIVRPSAAVPVNGDVLQFKANRWMPRTMAQLAADLNIEITGQGIQYVDTPALFLPYRNAINARLRLVDTASIHGDIWTALLGRVRWNDTALLHTALITAINARATKTYTDAQDALKINIADTTSFFASIETAINARLLKSDTTSALSTYQAAINARQATLVSATNIKTVNGISLLGSGDLTTGAGAVSWGSVAGTLSDQTDLQSALNLKSPLASPTFTGTPTMPTGTIGVTQSAADNSTALATTSFVTTADNLKANLASPALTGNPTVPTQAIGNNSTRVSNTEYVMNVYDILKDSINTKQYANAMLAAIALIPFTEGDYIRYEGGTLVAKSTNNLKISLGLQPSDVGLATIDHLVTPIINLDADAFDADVLEEIVYAPNFVRGLQALGSPVIAETLCASYQTSASATALTDGNESFQSLYLPKDTTLTGIGFQVEVQGDYTANNNNRVGLFTYSAGTMTLVASSANNGNLYKAAANTIVQAAFSSTYIAAAGIYYVSFIYNNSAQVTAPQLVSAAGDATRLPAFNFTNSARFYGHIGSKSDLDASLNISTLSANNNNFWLFVY